MPEPLVPPLTPAGSRWPSALIQRLSARWIGVEGHGELAWLAGVLLALLSLLGFLQIAEEMAEGETRGFDRAVLLAFRMPADPAQPIGPPWLAEVARDLTGLGGGTVLTGVTLGVAGYLALARKRGAALLVLASVGGGMVLSTLLKLGFDRPRPDIVPHAVTVYLASFPSGHAMLSAVTYLTLGALLARVQTGWTLRLYLLALAGLVTLLVGVSRVYLGVHWPTDVLAGWCAGAAWALVCWLVALWLQREGRVERSEPGAAPGDGERSR